MFCLNILFPLAQEVATLSSVSLSFSISLFFLVLPIFLLFECHFQQLCFVSTSVSVNISNLYCHLLLCLCASFSTVPFIMAFFVSPSFRRVSDLLFCLAVCCLFLLSILLPLSPFFFLVARFRFVLKTRSPCIYKVLAASHQVLCHVLYP